MALHIVSANMLKTSIRWLTQVDSWGMIQSCCDFLCFQISVTSSVLGFETLGRQYMSSYEPGVSDLFFI